MRKSIILIVMCLLLAISGCITSESNIENVQNSEHETISPYAGQEIRGIKSLSPSDIEGLIAGSGTPFGGMAKLAELNGYPGPRHVLDLADDMDLTKEQKTQIETIYEDMNSEAKKLGEQIIEIEKEMNDKFADGSVTDAYLKEKVEESAEIYGQLRYVHLKTHLQMMDVLSKEQADKYDKLRGYSSDDPCSNIPEGHDPELWKLHNNCE